MPTNKPLEKSIENVLRKAVEAEEVVPEVGVSRTQRCT